MEVKRLSDSEIIKREIEGLLTEHKIKYDSIINGTYDSIINGTGNRFVSIYVTTYKRAKDTIKLIMEMYGIVNLGFKKINNREYWINFIFEFLPITH